MFLFILEKIHACINKKATFMVPDPIEAQRQLAKT